MKKIEKLQCRWKKATGILVLLAVLAVGLFADRFAIVSHAESEGKVTASSANIRKEPSTASASLASAVKDAKVSIKGQLQGSDGYTWYQVFVDANTLGYVRSDLVEITDGSTPPAATYTPATPTPAPSNGGGGSDESLVQVTAVNPVSASVTGGQAVRVRQNASTTSRIVTTAQSGLALTVTGTAVGTDSKNWYQVSFISNSSEVNGFIRADYVEVKGDLVPVGEEPPADPEEPAEVEEPEPEVVKDWDTYYEGGEWHLIDNSNGNSYGIQNIFDIASTNKQAADELLNSKKKLQIVIVILAILAIGLAALVSYLIFKVKDMADSAYFNEVERETMRRRTGDRPQGGGQRVTQTVGPDRRPSGGQGQRPAGSQGQRPSGSGQGQRPAGSQAQRPAGSQGQRLSGSGQGQRPAGSQGQRPAGSGQRPADAQGQRPSGNGQRPTDSQGQRPSGNGQGQHPARQPKNFMADDDEFEFRFIDWDGEDEK